MAGSSIGTIFKVTTWGESHGPAIGAVIDGCPAGLPLSADLIQPFLDRRRPGNNRFTTKRDEADRVEILSGVYEGRTTGAPVSLLIQNNSHRPADYEALAAVYRPGHADFTYDAKYGFRDPRGGGRSSGRETAARVAAGAVATLLLAERGIRLCAYAKSIGPVVCESCDAAEIWRNELRMPDVAAAERAVAYMESCMQEKDSVGGVVECIATGVPAGLGDPVFAKLDAELAKAVFSIGAVKGVELGDGFAAARARGSENNDAFAPGATADKARSSAGSSMPPVSTNHAGGILGGISTGADIVLRAAFKPTPSITSAQQTIKKDGAATEISVAGRHDPCIVPRAVPVVEAMMAITLADALLLDRAARI